MNGSTLVTSLDRELLSKGSSSSQSIQGRLLSALMNGLAQVTPLERELLPGSLASSSTRVRLLPVPVGGYHH